MPCWWNSATTRDGLMQSYPAVAASCSSCITNRRPHDAPAARRDPEVHSVVNRRTFLLGAAATLAAAPDGYTLLASAFNHIILNHAVKGVTFDPQTDFETIGRTARAPLLMVLAPQRPQSTLAEVIAAAKTAPNDWTFAIPALG